jgi:large subunit ribosomal protein LP0
MPLSKEKKKEYFVKMERILETYSKLFIVDVTNVGSSQMNDTRAAIRGRGEILMGKNTLMRKVLAGFLEKNGEDHLWSALIPEGEEPKLSGNMGFVFTNDSLVDIRDIILANRVPAPARAGAIAPVDVSIPKGPTGCDPGQTSFFQTLQIPSKIVKGQIEITSDIGLIKAGEKVGASEAALLTKLNIRPFSYGLVIQEVFDNGSFFSVDVLDIDDEYLQSKFSTVVSALAALSFATGIPSIPMVPHAIANALKTMVAITQGLDDFTFPEADKFCSGGGGGGGAAAAAGGDAGAGDAPKKEEVKEEEIDFSGGVSMFGGEAGGGDY